MRTTDDSLTRNHFTISEHDQSFNLPTWAGDSRTFKILPDFNDSGHGGVDHFDLDDGLFLVAVMNQFDPPRYILSAPDIDSAYEAAEFALGFIDPSRTPDPDEFISIRWDGTVIYPPDQMIIWQIREAVE